MRTLNVIIVSVISLLTLIPAESRAESVPTRVGQCTYTRVDKIGTRFTDFSKAPTSEDIPGYTTSDGFNQGTSIVFTNGIYLVSYDMVPQVASSRHGDRVRMCLKSIPKDCPPNDDRGKVYSVTNLRTKKKFSLPDSQHQCGGA